ncbi:hypothetical protein [Paenibacillus sp. OSY-SE]|nr:hypothetical protein [Paenibacillus sp. OSY-SE]
MALRYIQKTPVITGAMSGYVACGNKVNNIVRVNNIAKLHEE